MKTGATAIEFGDGESQQVPNLVHLEHAPAPAAPAALPRHAVPCCVDPIRRYACHADTALIIPRIIPQCTAAEESFEGWLLKLSTCASGTGAAQQLARMICFIGRGNHAYRSYNCLAGISWRIPTAIVTGLSTSTVMERKW